MEQVHVVECATYDPRAIETGIRAAAKALQVAFPEGQMALIHPACPWAHPRFAPHAFTRLGVDVFLLEYDSPRAGGFAPLRHVAPGRSVVLGLISTKTPALEDADELARRIDAAARFVPLERLGVSPQCGFASTAPGNPLTPAEQRRKLELVVTVARRVWGR